MILQLKKFLPFLGVWASLSLFPSVAPGWTLNDVSILLPLPRSGEIDLLLGAESASEKGELLPFELFKTLPRIVQGVNPQELYEKHLRVIAIRIDPCFNEVNGPFFCRPQIRMVWQPVISSGFASITMDAAIHTFYDLEDGEWSDLVGEMEPLAALTVGAALDIHPVIKGQGLGGVHWSSLKKIFLKYAGKQNLSRATAMTVDPFGNIWNFSGVNIDNGFMTRMAIPRAGHVVQTFIADTAKLSEMITNISPFERGSDPRVSDWMSLVTNSPAAKSRMSEGQIFNALEQALRIENPLLEDTSTVDCVSCHVAQTARLWGDRNMENDWKQRLSASVFTLPGINLENRSFNPGFVNRLRAFGYFVDEPVISQRVVNESADVLTKVPGFRRSHHPSDIRRVNLNCDQNLKSK